MPGGPEYPVLGGVEYKHPLLPPTSTQGGTSGNPGNILARFTGTSSLTATASPFSSLPYTYSTAGTFTWICPQHVTQVKVEAYGGGGGGALLNATGGGAGGGGGAFANRNVIPVTPGMSYTVVVGAGGAAWPGTPGGVLNGSNGSNSSFTGDSGIQVVAVGGGGGGTSVDDTVFGPGGAASSCTGDIKFSGGNGGAGLQALNTGGAGGGASGNRAAAGNPGGNSTPNVGGLPGGVGANGGGSGGTGCNGSTPATNPTQPGGGGGGGTFSGNPSSGATGEVVITAVPSGLLTEPTFPLRGMPVLLPLSLQLKLNRIPTSSAPQAGVTRAITLTLAGTSSLTASVVSIVHPPGDHERPIFNGIAPAHLLPLPLTLKLTRQPSTASQAAIFHPIDLTIAGTSSLTAALHEPPNHIHVTFAGTSSIVVGPYDIGPKGVHLSQVTVEVARNTSPEVRLSQVTLEVLRPRTGLHVWQKF